MKIRELLSDESKWTKGARARNPEGLPTSEFSSDARCWCVSFAAVKCYGVDRAGLVIAKLSSAVGSPRSLASWNDAPERTFKEVKELVDRLDV